MGLSKCKIATIFLKNPFISYLYPSFSSIFQKHVLIGQYFTQFIAIKVSSYLILEYLCSSAKM